MVIVCNVIQHNKTTPFWDNTNMLHENASSCHAMMNVMMDVMMNCTMYIYMSTKDVYMYMFLYMNIHTYIYIYIINYMVSIVLIRTKEKRLTCTRDLRADMF